jgi:hypothetical protein
VIETTDQLRKALGVDADRGALIVEVQPRGPADRAGLRAGDVLTRVVGKPVGDARDALEDRRAGDEVAVHYARHSDARSARVKLARAEPPRMREGRWSFPLPGGVSPEKLEDELRRFRERVERRLRDLEDRLHRLEENGYPHGQQSGGRAPGHQLLRSAASASKIAKS